MKIGLKKLVYPFLGRLSAQPFFELLHFIALKGMNYGLGSLTELSGEDSAFASFLKEGVYNKSPIIFDVGANKGNYTSLVVRECGKQGVTPTLFAFEPSPESLNIFKEKHTTNNHVTIWPLAFSATPGQLMLYTDFAGSGLASLYNRDLEIFDIKMHGETEVEVTTLDIFCLQNNIEHIDFLKMDVEGSELDVLKGAKRMLSEKRIGWIQFEFGGTALDSRIYLKDFFKLLGGSYDIYRIMKNGLRKMNRYDERWEIFMTSNFIAKPK
jgi:FkbM family methyltransferase